MFSSISPEKARKGLEAVDSIFDFLVEIGTVLKAEGAEEAEEIKQLADILRFYNGIEVQLEEELASVLTTKVVGNEIIVSKGLNKVAKLPRNIDAYTKEIDRIVLKMGKDLGASKATKEMIGAIEVSFGKALSAGVAQGVEIGIAEEFIDDAAELSRRLGRRPVTAALEKQLEYVYAVQGHYLDEMEPKLRKAVAKELEKVSERWRKSATNRIRVINEDTVKAIQQRLIDAELKGQSMSQTAQGILDDLVEDAAAKKKRPRFARAMKNRADAIVKTELHNARQSAVISLGRSEGKKLFTWISMYDGRVCTVCAPRHNKTKYIENWDSIPTLHPR
jgi:hypothetical protein